MAVAIPLQRLSQAYERHARRLPLAVNLLLVGLIGLLLARLVWTLVPTPEAARWRPAPATPVAVTAAQPPVNVEALLAANIFGVYQATPGADLANAPDTRLNLTLLGILAGRGPRDSRALISDGTEEKPYAIGDDVARGATLEAIYPDRVILMRAGKAETLRLNKDEPSLGGDVGQPVVVAAPPVPAEGSATLATARDQVLQDPSKASEFIRVQPATQNGQMKGYRVYPGRDRQLFNSVGLRPGDVVTAVNGIELDNAQKALQMLNDLSRSNSFVLTVERGGQVQTVNVSIN